MITQISITWSADDVRYQARERGMIITDAQTSDILQQMQRNHDASIGISWDVIDVYLDALKSSGN